MSTKNIKLRIQEMLEEIPKIENVHKNPPFAASEADFIAMLTDEENKINAWILKMAPGDEKPLDMVNLNEAEATATIEGFYSYTGQESYDEFDDMFDEIRKFFRERWTLLELKDEMEGWEIQDSDPLQIPVAPTVRLVGGRACHYVQMILKMRIRITYQEGK